MFRNPLVVILGSTGVGKSKLAVEIAKKFGGEVISADSMQVYQGLDIITNKVTEEEMEGVRHHMLDLIEPPARFTVVDFRNRALSIINDLHRRGVLPVVVGGTNYYIESLVWKVLVEDEQAEIVDDCSDLIMNRQPHEEAYYAINVLLRSKYILEMIEFAERVFLAYLQFRIDAMPRFNDIIGDLLDSPANFSDSLLIHKATDVLDEIADYELGSILMCTRYRWIIEEFRTVEKVFLVFVQNLYELIRKARQNRMESDGMDDRCGEFEEELISTFRNLHKGDCLENFEFSVSDQPIPAEYATLSMKLDQLKSNNCYSEIRKAMQILDKVMIHLDYQTLKEVSDEAYVFAFFSIEVLLPRLLKIVKAESLNVGPLPDKLPSDKDSHLVHQLLTRIDPEMASRLHPNDNRKILRSLQVCIQKGRKHSEILDEQKCASGGSSLGGPLRFPNTVIFWLKCQQDILDVRLDHRVDDMMSRGLIQELNTFYTKYYHLVNPRQPTCQSDSQTCQSSSQQPYPSMDTSVCLKEHLEQNRESLVQKTCSCSTCKPVYTQGIFQSIGFKEFDDYLKLSDTEKQSEKGEKALRDGLGWLRLVTKRYAKRQNKWVNQRFLKTADRHVPPVYSLDTSHPSSWEQTVLTPASSVVSHLLGLSPDYGVPPLPLTKSNSSSGDNKSHHRCQVCDRVFIGDVQWNAHIKSKKHQRAAKKKQSESMELDKT